MERKKASDFPQELIDLFQLCVHGEIDRATFLRSAAKFAAGGIANTNDTTPRYDAAAATLGWQRTPAWFATCVRA